MLLYQSVRRLPAAVTIRRSERQSDQISTGCFQNEQIEYE